MNNLKKIIEVAKSKNSVSLLFNGPDGVGKRYNAMLLAKTVLCLQPDMEGNPCNECDNCVRADKSMHPNIIIIEPENKDIKIEIIRELIQSLTFAPAENGKRFVIIDGAHRMNTSSANALLKTLEEPPKDTCFILLVSNLKRLPSTIISRCEIFRFPPLSEENISSILNIPKGHPLMPYSLGSVSRMNFYMANSEEIMSIIKFMKAPQPSYKTISSIVGNLLEKTSNNVESFEYISSLLMHLMAEHIEQRAVQGLDYSGILQSIDRLKTINTAFYLNSQPSIVLENMLLDASGALSVK